MNDRSSLEAEKKRLLRRYWMQIAMIFGLAVVCILTMLQADKTGSVPLGILAAGICIVVFITTSKFLSTFFRLRRLKKTLGVIVALLALFFIVLPARADITNSSPANLIPRLTNFDGSVFPPWPVDFTVTNNVPPPFFSADGFTETDVLADCSMYREFDWEGYPWTGEAIWYATNFIGTGGSLPKRWFYVEVSSEPSFRIRTNAVYTVKAWISTDGYEVPVNCVRVLYRDESPIQTNYMAYTNMSNPQVGSDWNMFAPKPGGGKEFFRLCVLDDPSSLSSQTVALEAEAEIVLATQSCGTLTVIAEPTVGRSGIEGSFFLALIAVLVVLFVVALGIWIVMTIYKILRRRPNNTGDDPP